MGATFRFRCPECQAESLANERLIGRQVPCPSCRQNVTVQRPEPSELPEYSTAAAATRGSTAAVAAPPVITALPATPAYQYRSVDEQAEAEDHLPPVKFGSGKREETELDMTPMVDVTFLLLIFFMVTAAFALQKAIETPAPEDTEPSTEVRTLEDFQDNPEFVVVRIDAYNTYHVITTDWDKEAPSHQELLIKLREARQGNSQGLIPTRLLVVANGEALHETVVKALDAGAAVGMEDVQLVTVEEDEE